MTTKKEMYKHYQGLFELMYNEYELTLTISEMDEIIRESKAVTDKFNEESKKNN